MKTFATIILVLLTIVATAQNKPLNTVYFKNGSVIKGTITEYQVGKSIKIETSDKSIWVFNSSDVDKIEIPKPVKQPADTGYTLRKGLFMQLQFELMPSKKQSSEGTIPSMVGTVGYQINKHFSAGVGTGAEAFHISMMPLFGDIRYYFLNDRFTPYINLKAGYAFPLENTRDANRNVDLKSHGGIMGGVEFGYIKSLSARTKFTFSLGYRYQHMEQTGIMTQYNYYPPVPFDQTTNTYNADRKIATDFNRILITMGFCFW